MLPVRRMLYQQSAGYGDNCWLSLCSLAVIQLMHSVYLACLFAFGCEQGWSPRSSNAGLVFHFCPLPLTKARKVIVKHIIQVFQKLYLHCLSLFHYPCLSWRSFLCLSHSFQILIVLKQWFLAISLVTLCISITHSGK